MQTVRGSRAGCGPAPPPCGANSSSEWVTVAGKPLDMAKGSHIGSRLFPGCREPPEIFLKCLEEIRPKMFHSIHAAETATPQDRPGDLVVQASRLHISAFMEEKCVTRSRETPEFLSDGSSQPRFVERSCERHGSGVT